ncbi:MAG: hypothetical protein QNJ36_08400 [Calothrix sp. MO_167.B42]|nr:hypothetical protein [Calothrix sp. MO_167.B42]
MLAEKVNPWRVKNKIKSSSSQVSYLSKKQINQKSKLNLKSRFYLDYLQNEVSRSIHKSDKLLFFKDIKMQRSRDIYISRNIELEATFSNLVNQWRKETRGMSSINQMSMHPAYQQIIGMGEVAVPLLLKELEKKSGHWFWALKSISREDPVPPESKGKVKEMIKAWLEWGKSRGYKW